MNVNQFVRQAPGALLCVMAVTMVLLLADGLVSPGPEVLMASQVQPARLVASPTAAFVAQQKSRDDDEAPAAAAAAGGEDRPGSSAAFVGTGDNAATLAPYRKAKRRRKYSSDEKPLSTLIPGYGDVCASQAPRRRGAVPAAASGVSGADQCLPDVGASDEARCIALRRQQVLRTLDARNWSIEVWYMAGRKGYLDITSRYMKSTLRAFGGVAARVVWLYEEGQPYVRDYALREYKDLVTAGHFELYVRGNIRRMYRRSIESPRTLVVKLDDDTVFLQEHAVTAMMAELLKPSSRCLVVSGNVVNHVGLNPVHWHVGALDVRAAAKVSPQSTRAHRMTYDGYQRNVLGSYQEPIEWRQAHVSFLTALRDGALHRYAIGQRDAATELNTCGAGDAGSVLSFQCDGMWRRWGINLVAFPALGHQHFGSMRDLGHLVKNKDEVYFSMEMGRHVSSAKNVTCAVSDAMGVHFLNTGQASNVRKALGLSADGQGTDPRVKDASLLAPRLLGLYREVALHFSGVKPCCRSTGCDLFNTSWSENPNLLLALP